MEHLDAYFARIQKEIDKKSRQEEKEVAKKDDISESALPKQETIDEAVANGYVKLDHLELVFEEMELYDKRLRLQFPKQYFHEKIQLEDPNTIYYHDPATNANIIMSFAVGQTEVDLPAIKGRLLEGLKASELGVIWETEGIQRVGNQSIQYLLFTNPTPGDSTFNMMMFPTVQDGHIVINLNGNKSDFDKWQLIGFAMLKTMVAYE